MHNPIHRSAIPMILMAGVALVLSACGNHDGASNAASSNSSGANSGDSGANGTDFGENDMDSNVAQIDAANSTTVGGPKSGNATGNGAM
jgi:hypothetical protein